MTFLETVRLYAGIIIVKPSRRIPQVTLVETPVLEIDGVVCYDALLRFGDLTGDFPEIFIVSSQPETGDPR
jgi:hypothetical protein